MAQKKLGVLGGMGPMATVDFLRKLTDLTPSADDQGHVPLIVHTYPQAPDRTRALTDGGPTPLPYLIEGARSIEQAGASALVIPCNTAHAWYGALQAAVSIPIIHIADAALAQIKVCSDQPRIGLLSTPGTIKSGVYTQHRSEIHWVVPPEDLLNRSVLPAIRSVKANDIPTAVEQLALAEDWIKAQQVETVILACTELPVIADQLTTLSVYVDATQALAKQALAWWLQATHVDV